jgi:hypothetical protein
VREGDRLVANLSLDSLAPPGRGQTHTVVIDGYFESGPSGHFGMFPGAIVAVRRLALADDE